METSGAFAQRRAAAFQAACRRHQFKLTHQRLEIFRALSETTSHPDAETLYRGVRRRVAGVSRDTVYRALRLFETLGMARRVATVHDRSRYDATVADHHHFTCTACGRVYDVPDSQLCRPPTPAGLAALGTAETLRIEWQGRCRRCG